jgi:hypothetical protein
MMRRTGLLPLLILDHVDLELAIHLFRHLDIPARLHVSSLAE